MRKIVVNCCHGGFSLSESAKKLLKEEGLSINDINYLDYRDDPRLVEVVEKLGKHANGRYADLGIVEIPDDINWEINEYDGFEWVAEKHHKWYGVSLKD